MTRENSAFKYIAITLCIMLVMTSWGTVVCVSKDSDRGTQFFAVNFYLSFSPMVPHSLASGAGMRVISWMKKSEIFSDNTIAGLCKPLDFNKVWDKHHNLGTGALSDIYTFFKSTSFFLRI